MMTIPHTFSQLCEPTANLHFVMYLPSMCRFACQTSWISHSAFGALCMYTYEAAGLSTLSTIQYISTAGASMYGIAAPFCSIAWQQDAMLQTERCCLTAPGRIMLCMHMRR